MQPSLPANMPPLFPNAMPLAVPEGLSAFRKEGRWVAYLWLTWPWSVLKPKPALPSYKSRPGFQYVSASLSPVRFCENSPSSPPSLCFLAGTFLLGGSPFLAGIILLSRRDSLWWGDHWVLLLLSWQRWPNHTTPWWVPRGVQCNSSLHSDHNFKILSRMWVIP